MPFTYDPTTARGRVRLLVADTDETTSAKQIFTDAEIDAFLTVEDNEVFAAAAAACEAISASSARSAVAYRAVGMSIDKSDIPQHFMSLAEKYRERAARPTAEEIDSFDYSISDFGEDESEFVGDIIT